MVTAPPTTVTLAVAPCHVVNVFSLYSLTLLNVPLVCPVPPSMNPLNVTIPLSPWFLAKVSVAIPAVLVTDVIS